MKQLLFLLLFPCLCMAQYTGNAGQKITLGEQTTADGLVFRGVAADTTRKPSVDTMAYILLDTNTNIIWQYKKATSNAWLRLNLLPSDTSSMLTNYYRSGRALGTPISGTLTNVTGLPLTTGVTGTLPVANGGTNASTFAAGSVVFAGSSGTSLTQDNANLFWDDSNNRLGIGTASPTSTLDVRGIVNQKGSGNIDNKFESTTNSGRIIQGLANDQGSGFQQGIFGSSSSQTYFGRTAASIAFMYTAAYSGTHPSVFVIGTFSTQDLILGTNNTQRILIESGGAVTINNLAGINDVGADANGKLQAATSDMNLKNTIEDSPFGLNEILLLNPVTFLYNDANRKIDSDVKEVGFIAQDVFDIIPNAVSSTGTGDLQLDYRAITAALVKAIQEQQALIKSLEQRILILENK